MRRSVNVLSLSPFDDVNMRCLFALLVCLPSLLAITPRTVTIRVKQNITQECPNVRSDQSIVVRDSIGFDMNEINTGMGGMDSLHMITQTGEHKRITFPGCYNARLSMRVTRPLVNPYAEVFMQMGSDIPCRKQNQQRFQEPLTVCTNITRTNWCPKSANQQVRGMLDNKQTCQFCNLCESAIEEAQKN
uniref:Uncharacterized protein n=1 Tax=Plectus sambesii TaxID=2011161 RepID=A0A914V0U2_9BILA